MKLKKTKKMQMEKTTTFPNDILMEILCKLPVKSLARFRCVSKTWLNFISTPDFVNLHLNQSLKNMSTIMFSTYGDTFTIDYQTPCYEPQECDFPLCDESIVGFCNGLMCLYAYHYMALWNPATQEYLQIPYGPYEDESESLEDEERDAVLGFGYDPVQDQYKIVRSIFFFRDSEHKEFLHCEVNVCTLGTGEWRKIADPPCCLLNRHMVPPVNGALHWLGGLPIAPNSSDHKIISFDILTEEFRIVPWIESISSTDVTLGVLQGCLSTLVSCGDGSGIEVWMMKDYGVKESWTKLFSIQMPAESIEFGSIEPLVLAENGEMLLKSEREVYSYDGVNHILVETHCICEEGMDPCRAGHMYAESLVSINSLVSPEETDEDSP